jgi:hypothetical protein
MEDVDFIREPNESPGARDQSTGSRDGSAPVEAWNKRWNWKAAAWWPICARRWAAEGVLAALPGLVQQAIDTCIAKISKAREVD